MEVKIPLKIITTLAIVAGVIPGDDSNTRPYKEQQIKAVRRSKTYSTSHKLSTYFI